MENDKAISQDEFEEFTAAINTIVDALAEWCQIFICATEQIFSNIRECFYQVYLESGAPHSESDEGFIQWLEELNEALPEDVKNE